MTNPAVIAVAFFLLIFAGALAAGLFQLWLESRGLDPNKAHEYRTILGVVLGIGIMLAFSFATTPAPVTTRQETEPTPTLAAPWPTGTPEESGWHDFYDALVVTDAQHDYRIGVLETAEAAPTNYPVTPVSSATPMATATPVSKLCAPCALASDCDLNQTCYQCGQDKKWRCVWTVLRNGTCTQCINAGH